MESRDLGTLNSPAFTSQKEAMLGGKARTTMHGIFIWGAVFWGCVVLQSGVYNQDSPGTSHIAQGVFRLGIHLPLLPSVDYRCEPPHLGKYTYFLWFASTFSTAQPRGESTLSLWTRQESRIPTWRSNAKGISVLVCRMGMQTLNACDVVPYHGASS